MRIELPPPSWADNVQRAEDDAHTLTMAAPAQATWVHWALPVDATLAARVEVPAREPVVLTLTF